MNDRRRAGPPHATMPPPTMRATFVCAKVILRSEEANVASTGLRQMSVEFYVISREPMPSTPSHWTQPTHLVFLCFLFACSSLLHVIKRDVLGEMEGARQLCLGRNEPFSEPFFPCLYPFLPPFLGFLYPYGVTVVCTLQGRLY